MGAQTSQRSDALVPAAVLILRLVIGVVFIMHGAQKLFGAFGGGGIDGTGQFFGSLGLQPATFWAWVVALVEFVGGIALAIGLLSRWAGLLLAIDMAVAAIVVHIPNGFFVSNGGVELVLILFVASLFFVAYGGGKLSIDGMRA